MMAWRKLGLSLGIGLLSLSLWGCPQATTKDGKPILRVAMDPQIGEPFITKDAETKVYRGFEYDICQYIANKAGYSLEVVETPWDQLPKRVMDKKVDMALNALEKPARPEIFAPTLAFTDRYYSAYQKLVVSQKDTFTYNLSDLKDKSIGVVKGSVAEILLTELNRMKKVGIDLKPYPEPESMFKDLHDRKLKAVLSERAVASWYTWKLKGLKLTGDKISAEIPYVAAIHKENTELLKKVNDVLKASKKDPEFRKIFSNWHVSVSQ